VPVDGIINDELISEDRNQLWAEAVYRFRQGEKWWLNAEVEAIAAEVQNNYVESDVKDQSILEWIDTQFKPGEERFTVRQVLEEALGYVIDPKDRLGDSTRPIATAADQNRIQRRLRRLGYVAEPHQTRLGGERFRFWVPIGSRS
jgi:predicted P-loop ATPase